MKFLFILNDPPYGSERCFNTLKLALALLKTEPKPGVSVFLMAGAVTCAKTGQTTPNGYDNLERMIKGVSRQAKVILCGTCMDARGLVDEELVKGAGKCVVRKRCGSESLPMSAHDKGQNINWRISCSNG